MNILFLISNDGGNGVGGHYNSLNQVSREMARDHNVKVFTLGVASSPVVQANPYFERHISLRTGLKSLLKLRKEFKKITREFQPDLVHCFDTNSLNRALLSGAFKQMPLVLNKCGGKNPLGNNYYHADAIIVFSKENEDWFVNNSNYNRNDIFNIPNRVQKLHFIDESLREEVKDISKITFIRISRLGGAYEKTLLDTFRLIDKLRKKYPVELIVIGMVQNKERFDALTAEAKEKNLPVKYITDERAAKGSDFLYLADFVIGTGRSFMEATSLAIPSLTPVENADFPMLVTKDNFMDFLSTNFSERNIADSDTINSNLSKIEELIVDKVKYKEASIETLAIFNEFFGTDGILIKYNHAYDYALKNHKGNKSLIAMNFKYIIKFLLGK